MLKKYQCIRRHDITDCGAACLATISKQYGFKIPITKIREIASTDKQGTNAYGVIKATEELVFSASLVYTILGMVGAFYMKFLLDDVLPYSLEKILHILSIAVIRLYLF